MAKVYGVQPIPGVKDVYTLLDFLADSKAYEANLNAMMDMRDEIQALIGKVGKADQIETLLAQAKEKQAQAFQAVEQAKLQAVTIVGEAEAKAKDMMDSALALEKQNIAAAEKLEKNRRTFEEFKAAKEKDLQAYEQRVTDLEVEALKAQRDAKELIDKYEAKLAKFKAAAEE